MSATPRTDKAEHYGSTSDNCCLVHEDDMKELELENIKLQDEHDKLVSELINLKIRCRLCICPPHVTDEACPVCVAEVESSIFEENTKLLEVARAAKSDKRNNECTCYSDPERSCRYCGYFIRLDQALKSLEESGIKL